MGYCPFLGLCRDREFFVTTGNDDPVLRRGFSCRDMVLRSGARPGLGVLDSMRARQRSACAQESLLALCHNRDLRVTTLFPGQLGGLGRDRGFFYRDKAVSRQKFSFATVFEALGRDRVPSIATRVSTTTLWVRATV